MHGVAEIQCVPVIGIDMWEHAYLTQYQGDKDKYVEAFLASVDWGKASEMFEQHNVNGKCRPLL